MKAVTRELSTAPEYLVYLEFEITEPSTVI